MINGEIARIFYYIADMLEMQNVAWKPIAYRKAARNVESLSEDLHSIYSKGGIKALEEIPGIGEALAKKIEEYIQTGKIHEFEKLKSEMPVNVEELMQVEGLGPKRIMLLYKKLKIKNLSQLETAAKDGKLRGIGGLGEKTEENILKAIAFTKTSGKRKLLGLALPIAREIVNLLKSQKYIDKVEIAGSTARRKETVGDLDILITSSQPKKAMDFFTKLPAVTRVVAKGGTKATVIYNDIETDARVLKPEEFGSALQYFIGSKDHNVALRRIAIKKGYKLSEYGLFKGTKKIAGKDEADIYKKLGLQWTPPELRENRGEIEAGLKHTLPKLVELKDVRGDLHMHTRYSDGHNTVEEMARACKDLGYGYCAITDHVGVIGVSNPMKLATIKKRKKEIEAVSKKLNFPIINGAEVDIKLNGELAATEEMLREFEIVIASIHQGFRRPKEQQTNRILKAIENKHTSIIAHPTGRLMEERLGYELDFEKLFKAAKENNVAIEINAYPSRLDLNDINARVAKDAGVMLAIGTDAHHSDQLRFMELGVAVARRAWCEKKNILNTLTLEPFRSKIRR